MLNITIIAQLVQDLPEAFNNQTRIEWKIAGDATQKYRCNLVMEGRTAADMIEEIKSHVTDGEFFPERLRVTIHANVLYYDEN